MRISETFIIQSKSVSPTNTSNNFSTNNITSLTSSGITLNSSTLNPSTDHNSDIGSSIKRFRSINTISGSSSVWSSYRLNATILNLGLDSNNELRVITAENSIIQDDILQGGLY
jgi:hypothetical protein